MVLRQIVPEVAIVPDLNREQLEIASDVKFDRSPFFNFDEGDFVLNGGNIAVCEGVDNLRLWVIKTLATHINNYLAYNRTYGNLVNNYLGRFLNETLEAITPNLIRNTLLRDNRIVAIEDIRTNIEDGNLYVAFSVVTFQYDRFNVERIWSVS